MREGDGGETEGDVTCHDGRVVLLCVHIVREGRTGRGIHIVCTYSKRGESWAGKGVPRHLPDIDTHNREGGYRHPPRTKKLRNGEGDPCGCCMPKGRSQASRAHGKFLRAKSGAYVSWPQASRGECRDSIWVGPVGVVGVGVGATVFFVCIARDSIQ